MSTDHADILQSAKAQIESDCQASDLAPGAKGAFNLGGLLATLEKYGPGIVTVLVPIIEGAVAGQAVNPVFIVNSVVAIIHVIQNGGVVSVAPAVDPVAPAAPAAPV